MMCRKHTYRCARTAFAKKKKKIKKCALSEEIRITLGSETLGGETPVRGSR